MDYRKVEIHELEKVFGTQAGTGFQWFGKIGNLFLFTFGDAFKLLIEENGVCVLEKNGEEIEIVDERVKNLIDYYWNIKEWSGAWTRRIIL